MSDQTGQYKNAIHCAAAVLKNEGKALHLDLSSACPAVKASLRTELIRALSRARPARILQGLHNVCCSLAPSLATHLTYCAL
jgi:hypothetical protein